MAAFLLGAGSSIHCAGMCGGIISALSLSLPERVRLRPLYHASIVVSFNLGRIGSYTLTGAILGLLTSYSIDIPNNGVLFSALQYISALFLCCLGLHIAGWFPHLKRIEYAGVLLWQYLQPLARQFIPADTIPRALLVGAIWGWLPCGLVYSVLLWALATEQSWQTAIYMFAFGLGTLPGMIMSGVLGNAFLKVSEMVNLRRLAGSVIVITGLLLLFFQINPARTSGHEIHNEVHMHH